MFLTKHRLWLLLTAGTVFLLSLAILALVGVWGGIEVRLGRLVLLTCHSVGRPVFVCLTSLGTLLWIAEGRQSLARLEPHPMRNSCFISLLVFVVVRGLSGQQVLHGDSLEYIVQTQSIVLHQNLRIDTERLRVYWNSTNPFGTSLRPAQSSARSLTAAAQAGGGFGGLYPDRFGDYRYYHFWAYPLAVAPLYSLFHWMAPGSELEYESFRVMNVLLLCLPFILAWHRRPSWRLFILTLLALISPLFPYVDWHHPELFCFSVVLLGFLLARHPRLRYSSPALLGIAATQAPPLFLFFPLLALQLWSTDSAAKRRQPLALVGAMVGGALLGMSAPLYFKYYFGVFSVIEALGLASLDYASASRAADIFLSPMVGAFWSYPTCCLFLPACLRREQAAFAASAIGAMAVAAWLASSTSNFNSDQIGSLRYAVWLLVPFWYLVLDAPWPDEACDRGRRNRLFLVAAVANMAFIVHFQAYRLLDKHLAGFGYATRAVPAVATIYRWIPYSDDAETIIENILGREPAALDAVYVWNLGSDRSLWIVPKRVFARGMHLVWREPAIPYYSTMPEGNEVFRRRNTHLTLSSRGARRFAKHPLLGEYIVLWVHREVKALEGNVRSYLRNAEGLRQGPALER